MRPRRRRRRRARAAVGGAVGSSPRRSSCSGPRASATSRCGCRAGGGRHEGGAVLPLHGQVRPVHDGRAGADRVDPRGDGRGRERGRDLEERLVRLAVVGFERLRVGRLRAAPPCARAPRRCAPPAAPQGDGRAPGAGHPLLRGGRPAGPAAVARAASELLGGVLFSLIFAPGRRTARARCRRTGSSERSSRSGCSSAATGRSREARTSRPDGLGIAAFIDALAGSMLRPGRRRRPRRSSDGA